MSQNQNTPITSEALPDEGREDASLMSYTVVLLTPDYLAHQYGEDVQVRHVFAEDRIKAIMQAREETQRMLDTWEHNPDDFTVVFVCHGHQANIAP